jgi:multiple sugar transport system ATP-binding protein
VWYGEETAVAEIVFDQVVKVFPGGNTAVQNLSLHVADGEFMVLVGPSGCGKTTALRMIAGLEEVSDGTISIGGRVVNNVLPKDRDIAMVFQNYALYPQMTVGQNMGFALKIRNVAKDEIARRVNEAATILHLTEYLDRRPKALSGGQRQRVAMGRAIVREPQAFLMDEPLSNLDAQLRVEMRTEISRIQRLLGVATIYVTHDQTEAMTMGDRVAVMRGGVMQQVDTPEDLYDHPANSFVAGFIGSPPMNLLSATLANVNGTLRARFGDQSVEVPDSYRKSHDVGEHVTRPVLLGVRPEDLTLASADAPGVLSATVTLREALGSEILAHINFGGDDAIVTDEAEAANPGGHSTRVVARLGARAHVVVGERLDLILNPDNLHFFDAETGGSLRVVS